MGRDRVTLDARASGVLLHLSSVPGPHGLGDLGDGARAFVDFLASAGQRFWQMLPINVTGLGESPYSGASVFAGNPLFVSLRDLARQGLLTRAEAAIELREGRADFEAARALRRPLMRRAFERFQKDARQRARLESFRERTQAWLSDYALFMALARAHGDTRWTRWPAEFARRRPAALAQARRELGSELAFFEFEQLLFETQWSALQRYAQERGVGLIGDAPIFVAHDSADVWANQPSFDLDRQGQPRHVSGVPPDYFSATGQRWGTPLYRWSKLAREDYRWWVERLRLLIERFDLVRLDHFIGFARYWQIAASEATGRNGRWLKGPGRALFDSVQKELGCLPFIAEDLGSVTREVRELRDELGLPGMRVLQFAFGTDDPHNEFLPHNYVRDCVAYTGTHDNDTLHAWFHERGGRRGARSREQASAERARALTYLVGPGSQRRRAELKREVHWELIRMLFASVANTVIIPMQDLLGLSKAARMNTPGTVRGNWGYRVGRGALTPELAERLRSLSRTYGRSDARIRT